MQYTNILKAVFLRRPNRFIAHILLEGNEEICHVKNTGRCRELLLPGVTIYVQRCMNPARKTKYDLICVQKGDKLINMDSQAPNIVAGEWLKNGGLFPAPSIIRPETTWGDSRFDFYLEDKTGRPAFMEVKGVTLEEEGTALFPDAPTLRGVKHVDGLAAAAREGYGACLLFVIQMEGVERMVPNMRTHEAFGLALRQAQLEGVHLLAYDCTVTPGSLSMRREVPIEL